MGAVASPERYNASTTFVDANLEAGRGDKAAILYGDQTLTYNDVAAMMNRTGNALLKLGVQMEQRVMLLLLDSPEFVASFFGAIRMGAIPIPTNTLLRAPDYEYLLNDSRAVALIVSEPLYANIAPIREKLKWLKHVIVVGSSTGAQNAPAGTIQFAEWIKNESPELAPADTARDDACFWLYSSGTTGFPKGAVHLQHDMIYCAENYARSVLGINENDRTFSVAKLFFAYGLGNGLYFPFYVGATTVLYPGRPEPKPIYEVVTKYKPTLFFCVPTAYAGLLAAEDTSAYDLSSVRLCVSAGEALPKALFDKWYAKWNVEILDGIGSTEILHIFISNRAKEVRPGSSGKIVPGYDARIVDEEDRELPQGEVGNLLIRGDSTCAYYWNKHAKTKETIVGEWIRTGDKYLVDKDGYLWYQGRSDDMLKAGGIWVSPVEVEATLISHPAVLECAVIGLMDKDELIKPKAFVILKQGCAPSPELEAELKTFVKDKIAAYKYPRWIEFVSELPKTATGKIQRFKLRQREAEFAKGM
ncbi:MAG: benzoate-CoA ligase family protein [Chloroflexi bacterium]|nr:benzoate-CoA ligase family protein [Chloroflexota bacterium]